MSTNTPQPGSVADVVIKHLTQHGGTVTAATVSKLTGCTLSNVATLLRPATRAEWLVSQRATGTDGRKYVWSLGPRANGAAADTDASDAAIAPADALGIVTYEDGDVVVSGYREVEGGGGAIFSRAQMRQLVLRVTKPHIDIDRRVTLISGA